MNMAFTPDRLIAHPVGSADTADLLRIDHFVAAHPESTPFHRTAWMRAIEQGCGQDWRYLVVEDENDEIVAIVPLHMVHSGLFGRALVSSGFAVGGGILSTSGYATEILSAALVQFAEVHSFPSIELRGGVCPDDGWVSKSDIYAGFVTALAADDEAQLLAIPRKQRAEVRKGLKNGLSVTVGTAERDRDAHYAIYAESVRNLGTPVFPRALFEAVLDGFGEDADILTVSNDDQPVASVLSLYHDGTIMPYWGGGSYAARGLRANDIMYYALMNHARERGCARFDFGRSKVGTGAYFFKKNWGFEPSPLSYFTRSINGEAVRDINPMSPKYRMQVALWQKLPLPVANRIGPWIARGLG